MSIRFINATNVTADTNYSAIDMPNRQGKPMYYSIQVAWGTITGTKDSTVKLEISQDSTSWDSFGTEVTMSADNDSTTFRIEGRDDAAIRVVYTENNATNISTFIAKTSLPPTIVAAV